MRNSNEILHEKLDNLNKEIKVSIDMTAGRGHDTLKLAQISEKVYTFDIQEEAIESTKELTKDFNNIQYILDSHLNVDKYVKPYVDVVMINCGYLPGGNKKIITNKDNTVMALSKVHRLLKKNSVLMITVYPGHPGGKEEAKGVYQWIKHHVDRNQYTLETLEYDTKNSPIAYIMTKINI